MKKSGIIISSCISGYGALEEERGVLEKDFNLHTLPEVYQLHLLDSYSPGYYYTKKRKRRTKSNALRFTTNRIYNGIVCANVAQTQLYIL